MRRVLIIASALVCSQAFASFELALITDSTQKCVHRYDPVTGAYMGNFGKGSLLNVTSIAVDRSTSKAFVLDGYIIRSFNFNTGEYLGSSGSVFSTSAKLAVDPVGGRVYVNNGPYVDAYDESLTFQTTYTEAGASFTAMDIIGGRYLTVQNQAAGRLDYLDLSLASPTFVAGSVTGDSTGITTMAARNDGSGRGIFFRSVAPGYIRLHNQSTAYANNLATSLTTVSGLASGHGGKFYAVGTNASGASVMGRYIADSSLYGGESDVLNISNVTTPAGIATVIAPEPSTMVALGLGALALLKRRKKS